MNELVHLILNNPGLYGIFSRPSFGKTTLLMQLVDEALKIKNGKAIVLSFEMLHRQWFEWLEKRGLCTDNIVVFDNADKKVSFELLDKLLEKGEKPILIAVDYLEISDISVEDYYKLSKKYSVPLVMSGEISRKSQYRKNCKPEFEDIMITNEELNLFDFISILHRDNDGGTCFCTNENPYISDNAKLIISKNNFAKLETINLTWDKEKKKFIY